MTEGKGLFAGVTDDDEEGNGVWPYSESPWKKCDSVEYSPIPCFPIGKTSLNLGKILPNELPPILVKMVDLPFHHHKKLSYVNILCTIF